MPTNLENSAVTTRLKEGSFHFNLKEGNAKECSNYHTIEFISQANKIMLKIFQARLQKFRNQEHPNVQVQLQRGRGTRDQIANIHWIMEKVKKFH